MLARRARASGGAEPSVKIPVSHGYLEATLREPEGEGEPRGAAVVCHPHPLHGGTMHTKAVFRTAQALNEAGLLALRFNFRGVGTSTGSYEEGVGEKEDVRAALDWLADEAPGLPLVVAGFSFGSIVGLSVGAEDERVRAMVGLGLPLELSDASFLADVGKPVLVVQGEHDQFASAAGVQEEARRWGDHVTMVAVAGADHFFHERFDELREAVREYFLEGPGADALETQV